MVSSKIGVISSVKHKNNGGFRYQNSCLRLDNQCFIDTLGFVALPLTKFVECFWEKYACEIFHKA